MERVDDAVNGDTVAKGAIIQAINEGVSSWVDFVEALGPSLTHEQPTFRQNGTSLFVDVVVEAKSSTLSQSAIPFVVQFLCDRVQDYITSNICLRGLLHLSDHNPILAKEDAVKIVRSLFEALYVQAQPQTTRQLVFRLMLSLLKTHSEHLSTEMKEDFVAGFLQQIDGEKDPRCLSVVFDLVPFVAKVFPMGKFVEDMFEVTACYFPITFNPPPNDPYGITKEGLKMSLAKCMVASPLFAPYCLDMLLDKVTTRITEAKVDCFNAIAEAARAFGFINIQASLSDIYKHIRKEMFESTEETVHKAALSALSSCVSVMQKTHQLRPLKELWEEARHHLSDVDASVTTTQGKMVVAVVGSGDIGAKELFKQYLSHAVNTFLISTSTEQVRTAIARVVSGMCRAYDAVVHSDDLATHFPVADVLTSDLQECLKKFVDGCFDLGTDYVKSLAVATVGALVNVNAVSELDVSRWLDNLIVFCKRENHTLTRQALAQESPSLAKAFPSLAGNVVEKLLSSVSTVSSRSELGEVLDVVVCFGTGSNFAVSIFRTLIQSLYSHSTRDDMVIAKKVANILCDSSNEELMVMVSTCVSESILAMENGTVALEEEVVEVLSSAIASFWKRMDRSGVEEVAILALNAFGAEDSMRKFALSPQSGSSWMWCFQALVGVLPRDVSPAIDSEICTSILKVVNEANSWSSVEHMCAVYGSCFNKSIDYQSVREGAFNTICNDICSNERVEVYTGAQLCLFAYVARAVVVASDAFAPRALKLIFTLLQHRESSQDGCRVLDTVLQRETVVLSRDSNAYFKLMYAQRFFQEHLPTIVKMYEEDKENASLLCALSTIIRSVPKQVLMTKLNVALPLLITSLTLQNERVLLTALETLFVLVHDAPKVVEEHIDTLVTSCLEHSQHHLRMSVRKSALETLGALTTLTPHIVVPHTYTVLKCLGKCVDDRKRIVRVAAASARSKWYLIE
eukprot:m.75356 g.75356  ORF g.75356 m.75356 type:complete len:967 (+) comp8478_c0_seq3:29-2929(+)